VIALRDVAFGYPRGEFLLRVPRFDVGAGETLALKGPSGSGKTTLVNLIAGILAPRSGRLEVAGFDLAALGAGDRQDLRALKMGLVFQEFELLEYLDVLDNVLLPYRITPVLELDEAVRRRARELASEVGLGDKLRRYPGELSQGERQRVAVCRALLTRPALVLGDEPTGNLDPANRDHVLEVLLRYGGETGAPVVVVTHDHEILPRFGRVVDVTELAS